MRIPTLMLMTLCGAGSELSAFRSVPHCANSPKAAWCPGLQEWGMPRSCIAVEDAAIKPYRVFLRKPSPLQPFSF